MYEQFPHGEAGESGRPERKTVVISRLISFDGSLYAVSDVPSLNGTVR